MGLAFLLFVNPLSVFMEKKYEIKLDKNESSLYSIKISYYIKSNGQRNHDTIARSCRQNGQ